MLGVSRRPWGEVNVGEGFQPSTRSCTNTLIVRPGTFTSQAPPRRPKNFHPDHQVSIGKECLTERELFCFSHPFWPTRNLFLQGRVRRRPGQTASPRSRDASCSRWSRLIDTCTREWILAPGIKTSLSISRQTSNIDGSILNFTRLPSKNRSSHLYYA